VKSLRHLLLLSVLVVIAWPLQSATPIQYHFTFPEPEHRWMQVDATFSDVSRSG
jgi:hypothetical protein